MQILNNSQITTTANNTSIETINKATKQIKTDLESAVETGKIPVFEYPVLNFSPKEKSEKLWKLIGTNITQKFRQQFMIWDMIEEFRKFREQEVRLEDDFTKGRNLQIRIHTLHRPTLADHHNHLSTTEPKNRKYKTRPVSHIGYSMKIDEEDIVVDDYNQRNPKNEFNNKLDKHQSTKRRNSNLKQFRVNKAYEMRREMGSLKNNLLKQEEESFKTGLSNLQRKNTLSTNSTKGNPHNQSIQSIQRLSLDYGGINQNELTNEKTQNGDLVNLDLRNGSQGSLVYNPRVYRQSITQNLHKRNKTEQVKTANVARMESSLSQRYNKPLLKQNTTIQDYKEFNNPLRNNEYSNQSINDIDTNQVYQSIDINDAKNSQERLLSKLNLRPNLRSQLQLQPEDVTQYKHNKRILKNNNSLLRKLSNQNDGMISEIRNSLQSKRKRYDSVGYTVNDQQLTSKKKKEKRKNQKEKLMKIFIKDILVEFQNGLNKRDTNSIQIKTQKSMHKMNKK